MMNNDELYIGMRVIAHVGLQKVDGQRGTIIDLHSRMNSWDCLVEFDEHVGGHSGLGWGKVSGEEGHCYWCMASQLEEVVDDVVINTEACSISYDELF